MTTPARHGIAAADLLLALAAVLLLVAALMVPSWRTVLRDGADLTRAVPDTGPLAPGQVLVLAMRGGLRLIAPGTEAQDLDDASLPDDPRLLAWLADWPEASVVLVLTHDSGDTGFLAEAGLARAGVARIGRLRLPGPCARLTVDSLGAACAEHPG